MRICVWLISQKNTMILFFAAAVLHHLRHDDDWEEVFSKIYRLLAPAGTVWITDLVWHENSSIQEMMWVQYGKYLESIGGIEYRNKVFGYIDKEDLTSTCYISA